MHEDEEPEPAEGAPEDNILEDEIGDGQDEQKIFDSDEVRAEHVLHHLPKDKNCPICTNAKMLHVPPRKFANQSELRQHEHMKFVAKEPFDLISLDLKIVKKGSKGHVQEAFLNVLEAFTGSSRTYRLTTHDTEAIRNYLVHFAGRRASTGSF